MPPSDVAKHAGRSTAIGGVLCIVVGSALMQAFEGFEGLAAVLATLGGLLYLAPWVLAIAALVGTTEWLRMRLPTAVLVAPTALLTAGLAFVAFDALARTLGAPDMAALTGGLAAAITLVVFWMAMKRVENPSKLSHLAPGMLAAALVVGITAHKFALWDSISRSFFDPNGVLLTALAFTGLLAGGAFTLIFRGQGASRHQTILASLAGASALSLAYANRFIITPRLYLEAHLALSIYEWLLISSAASVLIAPKLRSTGRTILAVTLAASAFSLALNDGRTARRVDHTTEIFSSVWSPIADIDGDGFYAEWLGGVDCDDADPERHPFAREIPGDGIDQNCLGSDPPLIEPSRSDRSQGATAQLVLLISIDMLRPDYMSIYGADRPTTPNLDAERQRFVRFDNAYASGGITTLSLPSLTRGRIPLALDFEAVHRTTDYVYTFPEDLKDERVNRTFASVRSDRSPTIASVYAAHGLEAHAFVDDGPSGIFQKGLGFENGFSSFTFPNQPDGPGPEGWNRVTLTDDFVRFLKDAPPKSFAWLHYYDPHNAVGPCRDFEPTPGLGCYRDAIFDIDAQIGRIFRELKERGLWESTTVIISSDHGEALGEHRLRHHGTDAYEEFVRIPLLFKPAHSTPSHPSVDHPVSLIDASATALLEAQLAPPATFQGHDLLQIATGTERPPVISQGLLLTLDGKPYRQTNLLVLDDRRVMYDRASRRSWAYDLNVDPHQKHPRRPTPEELEVLFETLSQLESRTSLSLPKKLP